MKLYISLSEPKRTWVILFSLLMALSLTYTRASASAAENEASSLYDSEDDQFQTALLESYNDDLFELIDRGVIRVLVTYSKTHFFIDGASQHGLTHEVLREFERYLSGRYKTRRKGKALAVVAIPVARDELLSRLENGQGELAVANLTITPDRKRRVDFSIPTIRPVSEVVVASSAAPPLERIEDLSGKTVYLRKSSSFFTHLQSINKDFAKKGIAAIELVEASEHLEVEDLIEMANADLISYTVADNHIADLWRKIFADIKVYDNIALNSDGSIAWAVRKNTPNLMYEVNRFLKRHRSGTLFGNIVKERYLDNPYWPKRALSDAQNPRFDRVVNLFKKYSDLYDFNHLMLLAQGYQESELDHSKTSPVGAIGIMQLMPRTGDAMQVGDIRKIENNVRAGSKYLRTLIDQYFNDPEIDETNRVLFAFAAYNAGPTRIKRLRQRTARLGLDPNVWFGNVEHTVARYVGRETVTYVSNISKYFIAYKLIEEQERARDTARQRAQSNL